LKYKKDDFIYGVLYLYIVSDQERMWEETLAEDPATELEARQGGLTPTNINPRLYHDIQVQLSRLVGKAEQLIGNTTTNLAECWMHIRCKFDGGKSSTGHKVGPGNSAALEQVCVKT
jgi:hypothetical protein